MKLDKIEDALQALKAGKSVIVVDDENRENEGDLVAAATRSPSFSLFSSSTTITLLPAFKACSASSILSNFIYSPPKIQTL